MPDASFNALTYILNYSRTFFSYLAFFIKDRFCINKITSKVFVVKYKCCVCCVNEDYKNENQEKYWGFRFRWNAAKKGTLLPYLQLGTVPSPKVGPPTCSSATPKLQEVVSEQSKRQNKIYGGTQEEVPLLQCAWEFEKVFLSLSLILSEISF